METLKDFVTRVMEEKNITPTDIMKKTNNGISDVYVNNILKGTAKNPSSLKIKALAAGLGEDPRKVAEIAMEIEPLSEHDPIVSLALEWARLAKIQGDSYWVKKIKQDNEKMRQLIAEGRVSGSEPNGEDGNDKPGKPGTSGGGKPDMIHSQLRGSIAV